MYAMTAAHPLLPIPSYARVTRPSNGRSIIVRINDRGPFHDGRIIDLSYVAAAKLGIIGPGSGQVIVQAITPDDIRKGSFDQPTLMASNNTPATAAPPTEVETRPIDEPASVQPVTPDALSAIDLAESGTAQPAEAADTTQVAAAPAGIYLQFGAFSNPENAEALVERIKVQLAASERGALHIDPSPNLYRVRMGPFSSRTQAVNAAAQIEAEIGARPTIALR
jgi:rare lipoprotein A